MQVTNGPGHDAYFELSFSPNASLVSTVRRFVSEFYSQVLSDGEITSRLAVATHELLENAVRYSVDGETSIRIGMRSAGPEDLIVTIDTQNRAGKGDLAMLARVIDEIASSPDPDACYQSMMRRSAKRSDGSGLGLGRIRAESDMTLSCRVDGDRAILHAETRVRRPA